jgi:transcriptional regulator with XRE-family HTH domain
MISDTIKELRRKNYLNQTAFANKIGVTQGTVSQWEHNLIKPSSDQLKSISLAFGISVDDLLAGEDVSDPNLSKIPHTPEARILATGIDKLPKEQREQALNVVKAMFAQYADYFEKVPSNEP